MKTREQKEWMRYQNIWKFRDLYFNKILRRRFFLKFFHREPIMPFYAKKRVMMREETNRYLMEKIESGKPFMACRFGNTELQTVVGQMHTKIMKYDMEKDEYTNRWFTRLGVGAGFFPSEYKYLDQFVDCILNATKEADLLAMWHLNMEDYIINQYAKDCNLTFLFHLEPWLAKNPWTAALEGKKVLVIHPFEDTIRSQYKKRALLFPNTKVLPEFELKTLKAVQTICNIKDERFDTWFDALEYMEKKALEIEFDLAIIGCGAYGMPLAAKLKKAGKQAVHLGGATQLLFGIKGKRWGENYPTKIATCFNEHWTYPLESEKPKNAKEVEGGCYWG